MIIHLKRGAQRKEYIVDGNYSNSTSKGYCSSYRYAAGPNAGSESLGCRAQLYL